jgi:hypothetical protein
MADPETIGKYRIVERIGRGGMGTIFKAHDPVLNRSVALKVISTDADLVEDVRLRFFREAQACARLSHPNIITVYDMGEDAGRLFIVMELLDGTELHRLIADGAPLALEDRLSIMTQVCDGLHYAHQRGIVHRDIKPSNIMRLRNGQVKILDFGIARMESFHETLTRTGLIMGTLRYMAPEQARGRADHRTDIFSVGAVLYEFLSSRPPFLARDPLHLLEQLRTEEPTPLHVVDPTIPAELSEIATRAMQKDPAARTPDLAQMRAEIEQVQRGLAEEARRVEARIRAQREQLQRLEAAVARHVGSSTAEAGGAADDPRHLADLQALEADLLARTQAAKETLARATALAPAFERGSELLEAGQLADAIVELERVVAEMPGHGRAAAALARARADEDRRAQLTKRLVQEARAALAASRYELCLQILDQIVAVPPPAEAVPEIRALRDTAEAAVAMQHQAPGAREEARGGVPGAAEPAREALTLESSPAEDDRTRVAERPTRTEPLRTGKTILEDEAPARAHVGRWIFSVSVALGGLAAIVLALSYSRSPHVSPAPPPPQMTPSTPSPAPAQATPPAPSPAPPQGTPSTPSPLPPQVTPSTPSPALPPASRGTADAGDTGTRGPAGSTLESTPRTARPAPEQSPAREAETARPRPEPPALPPARRGESRLPESRPRGRPEVKQAEEQMASARHAAEKEAAGFYARTRFSAAQATEREAGEALRRGDFTGALRLLAEARSGYQAAAQEARRQADRERQLAPLKASVEQARDTALARRRQALAAGAERLAMDLLRAAETRHAEADGLASQQDLAAALRAYGDAAERYSDAERQARAAGK